MLARLRPGLLVIAAAVATPMAACSSDSDDAAAASSGAPNSSSASSGGAQSPGDSSEAASTTDATSGNGDGSGGTSSGDSDTSANGPTATSDGTDGTDSTDGTDGTDGAGGTNGETGGSSGGAGAPGDAPYANVVAVAPSGNDGAYSFSVSIESSDVDCSQFADWWEVVSEDGMLLYRRILEHSHTDENGTSDAGAPGNTFTRSGGPVNVAEDQVLIIRAHMSNLDEYNGASMRGSVALGFETATDLDPSFAADLESADPQPDACLF